MGMLDQFGREEKYYIAMAEAYRKDMNFFLEDRATRHSVPPKPERSGGEEPKKCIGCNCVSPKDDMHHSYEGWKCHACYQGE